MNCLQSIRRIQAPKAFARGSRDSCLRRASSSYSSMLYSSNSISASLEQRRKRRNNRTTTAPQSGLRLVVCPSSIFLSTSAFALPSNFSCSTKKTRNDENPGLQDLLLLAKSYRKFDLKNVITIIEDSGCSVSQKAEVFSVLLRTSASVWNCAMACYFLAILMFMLILLATP